ncbi:RsmB/NOP family class I SAM-dependent RNA methyltransferase [Paenibacillus lentus]|uniref:rRNA cytosine-C5-methyltransferase n=1 Tax=Paenibacillus lentus TaxID=1338368 RepID=A0A3S8RYI7_9BACL|nr:RsmB/NOP family class I SAM-dependent RNA methyltransferase [Paenibacillus lentus]AZK47991.1 rRNA cytosine-C5-methyltransferase [Paenibacillus lentus]
MAVHIPNAFLERMQQLLGSDYDAFRSSYDNPRYVGIRVNTLKISVSSFLRISPFELKPVPWCSTGFYVQTDLKPGKHPYYHAGLYYIQEPSAMAPVELLDVVPGEKVLDLCAAPGGKSTQIAAKLQGEGLLVTNDINAERTRALAKNMELYGVRSAVVLNEAPEHIARSFPAYFDKILIDAPCSGEGMFRKDEDMARQWEVHSTSKCTVMQHDLLNSAAVMLAPGGRIVYSTCTFAPEENEAMIARFLDQHADFELVPLPQELGFAPGRPEWLYRLNAEGGDAVFSSQAASLTAQCGRLWPHLIEGEGHFLAVLQQKSEASSAVNFEQAGRVGQGDREEWTGRAERAGQAGRYAGADSGTEAYLGTSTKPSKISKKHKGDQRGHASKGRENVVKVPVERELLECWQHFASQHVTVELPGQPLLFGSHVYLSPLPKEQLAGLKTVRPGWYVGTVKNGRFAPGHPLATALSAKEASRVLNLDKEQGEAVRYLKGETLNVSASRIECRDIQGFPKGYVLVCVDGISLGWGKWLDGMLKNEYPAGWRWT